MDIPELYYKRDILQHGTGVTDGSEFVVVNRIVVLLRYSPMGIL